MPDIPDPPSRRRFMKSLAGLSAVSAAGTGLGVAAPSTSSLPDSRQRERVNALLLSATTVPGQPSLSQAWEALPELYGENKQVLLINFASLPPDRDAYAKRMQREFDKMGDGFTISSLHHAKPRDAARVVREAEAFFISGGNTFLLLRELYDRFVVDLIRERVLMGVPYAGSSAGSNVAGTVIGCTNDFPLVDVPTRRSLGILPGVFNPHHPDPELDPGNFEHRQWKISHYASHQRHEPVFGITDPGMIRIQGNRFTLLGKAAWGYLRQGDQQVDLFSEDNRDLTAAMEQVG